MGDEGRDLCECLWGHELAMRRLLNLIRNSQATCTDSECFEDGGFRSQGGSDTNGVLMAFLLFVVVLYLFFFRPSNNSRSNVDARKPNNNNNNNDGNNGNRPTTSS